MSIHDDSPTGARLRKWIYEKYGSLKKAAEGWGISPTSINPVLRSKAKLGSEWIQRIVEGGGDYEYILTGRRSDSEADTFNSKQFLGSANYLNVTPDDIRFNSNLVRLKVTLLLRKSLKVIYVKSLRFIVLPLQNYGNLFAPPNPHSTFSGYKK